MAESDNIGPALRIERGCASDEELAAVAVVLYSLSAGRGDETGTEDTPEAPLWQPERSAAAYRSPYSWR
ncbi:acyl-CoA carboxylase subunit epsilon [Streptomyces lancefieldiae]|uniref:Acyl-CoA carboxylase subunit epsilon n=1 Tax=Streptomyces lancefieldiae TaxID=3075520 RepID=A0ABU3AUH5_9ACTN|nr:acyl-CoA carboxylase subunit epsilon [Streptomyces sp. DSM 40712]MDT0612748.1 acyl-CoA carboxylase subunit epsilon [Streptomyces sp. DSM 40712]